MASPAYNTTGTPVIPSSAPSALLSTICASLVSKLPFSFSYVQQVHIKLKAESAVMIVFYALKQVHVHLKKWCVKRQEGRVQQRKDKAKGGKNKRKNRGRRK